MRQFMVEGCADDGQFACRSCRDYLYSLSYSEGNKGRKMVAGTAILLKNGMFSELCPPMQHCPPEGTFCPVRLSRLSLHDKRGRTILLQESVSL